MAKKLLVPLLAFCLSAATAAVASRSWTEMYAGLGSGGDRDSACENAKSNAQTNSMSACLIARGHRADESFTDCVCSAIGDSVHACNVKIKVSCERSGR